MKMKRMLFIASLITLFLVCYVIMNKHYDELARYTYATEENRDIILKYLSTEDINFLSAQQIKPEEFLPFIEEPGFTIYNALWYHRAKSVQEAEPSKIVNFINTFKSHMKYGDLETLLMNYSYDTLSEYYRKGDRFIKNASLITNPSAQHLLLSSNQTLYTYEPKDLELLRDIPTVQPIIDQSKKGVYVKKEVVEPLQKMCSAAEEINGKTCGDLIVNAGYISYEDQVEIYEKALVKYGHDSFLAYEDYPGRSEFQLGYTIRFIPAGSAGIEDIEQFVETKQSQWLAENAHKFGFIIRYPKGKENITGKQYQPYTLRYVGEKVAQEMYEKQLTLGEMVFKNE
ncbi:MAG: M15 family metallopeptidase [Erysipelotrichaceae bacterium]|nr:M15 family metallopeptidase [Erysipelotrichaceae bacterium]